MYIVILASWFSYQTVNSLAPQIHAVLLYCQYGSWKVWVELLSRPRYWHWCWLTLLRSISQKLLAIHFRLGLLVLNVSTKMVTHFRRAGSPKIHFLHSYPPFSTKEFPVFVSLTLRSTSQKIVKDLFILRTLVHHQICFDAIFVEKFIQCSIFLRQKVMMEFLCLNKMNTTLLNFVFLIISKQPGVQTL